MVNRRLMHFLDSRDLLDHRQHAFRPGHGTNTYFATLGQVLRDAFSAGKHTELAALDISKAYNRAWMPDVILQMVEWGLGGHMLHFVKNFLLDRTFQVVLGNHRSKTFQEETGVPQGSVLAVTLFLIRMNGIYSGLPKEIYIFIYADDIVIVAISDTDRALRRKMGAATRAVSLWASSVGFQLSAAKSSFAHICPHHHRPLSTPIHIDGNVVPLKKSVRILGVRLDQHLTFAAHFDEVKSSCKTRLNLLRSIAGRHPDSNRSTRLNVARAILESRLFYGVEITCLAREMLISKLTPTYQEAIRICSGLLPSTPGVAACIESGMLPFDRLTTLTICKRAISFAEKTDGSDEGVFLLAEAKLLLHETTNLELPPVSRVHWCGARGWNLPKPIVDYSIKRKFRAGSNSPALVRSVAELQRTKYNNHTIRYSDGSAARQGVGIGITDSQMSLCHRLPDQFSIFSAEAAAAFIAATTPSSRPIAVFTDSASVIEAIGSDLSKHPWIQGIQKYSPTNTSFIWIPGHSGIRGNIEADHMAASGRQAPMYTREVPSTDLKHWVSKVLWNSWSSDWLHRGDTFIRQIKEVTHRWDDSHDHRAQVVMSRLRTGHTNISHNFSGNGPFRRICASCHVPHTVEHIICQCPQYAGPRELYNIPESIKDALSEDPTRTAALICFLKDSRLFETV